MAYSEIDRWMYLFTQGEEVDVDEPPTILQTEEMKEAIRMLQHFSENEREYLLYQKRLDSMRVEATWLGEIERTKIRAEKAEKDAKKARKDAENAKKNEGKAIKDAAEAKKREEQERCEKERLLELLKQAGIDPNC